MRAKTTATPGVIRVLEDALARAKSGGYVGVTVIEYAQDGGWSTTNAGTILRSPAVGIAAAQVLSSEFVRRMETDDTPTAHHDRRS